MRFCLGLLSSTQGVETLQEDEITVGSQIREKLSVCDAAQFDKLYNELRSGVWHKYNFLKLIIYLLLYTVIKYLIIVSWQFKENCLYC